MVHFNGQIMCMCLGGVVWEHEDTLNHLRPTAHVQMLMIFHAMLVVCTAFPSH